MADLESTTSTQGEASPSLPGNIDINALASILKNPSIIQGLLSKNPSSKDHQQGSNGQQQQQQQPAGLQEAMSDESNASTTTTTPQAMMEQIANLTKSLEAEKAKSKALQEEKKREMKGFLTGIKDFVNGLDGVKDPTAKEKFMQGMENMANHGIPNGVYDIMVSASALHENNMKTIEALTKGYSELKNKYEGAGGQFATEASRFVDPNVRIIDAGSKRKKPDNETVEKVPVGMWDAFGDDIAKLGYNNQPDLFMV